MFLDLLAARTRCRKVFFGVPFDFRLAALTALDFVAKFFQPMGNFRTVDCRRILLRLVNSRGVWWGRLAVVGLGKIKKAGVGVYWGGGAACPSPGVALWSSTSPPPPLLFFSAESSPPM